MWCACAGAHYARLYARVKTGKFANHHHIVSVSVLILLVKMMISIGRVKEVLQWGFVCKSLILLMSTF